MYVSLNFIGTRRVRKKFCFPHDYTTVRINMPSFIKIRCLHPLAKVVFTDIRHIQERQKPPAPKHYEDIHYNNWNENVN